MKDNKPHKSQLDGWWSLKMTSQDLASAGFEERERGPEAEARHQAYLSDAFATLSPIHELCWYGARAGVQVGAALLAVEAAVLIAIIAAAFTVDRGVSFATLYGSTPLVGTPLEALWPVVIMLPVLPLFAVFGAIAALMRRLGNIRTRALDSYFNPRPPRLDMLAFWLLISGTLMTAAAVLGFTSAQSDPTGIIILALCAGGLIAWPCQRLWLMLYLPSIRAQGSASLADIRARIQRQI